MAFEFQCSTCGETHTGIPSFGPDAPESYYTILEAERPDRCELGTDDCIIDGDTFFVRGCLQIPVHSITEPFVWLVWCSLSVASFKQWVSTYEQKTRSDVGPFFGWLNTRLPFYEVTLNLKTMVHLRDDGLRPLIELEPTEHPLAVAQRDGISAKLAEEMISKLLHPDEP
ncbi:MAG: DUF2199 domain-containing protein [Alphaproteobacteria bacterium]|nr:DUF2199 domain-containing protein [Alphaproteobacteria bacterium]